MFLLVDNYDSFTWNIYHSISGMGIKVIVKRNDKIYKNEITKKYKGIIFSPGPGHPKDSSEMTDLIKNFKEKIPLLGICLGHQALALSFGAKILKMKKVTHGKTDKIFLIKNNKLFKGFPNSFFATRYHSLEIAYKNIPKKIQVVARSKNKTIMAIKIRNYDIYGVQFHPESIASEFGDVLFRNFVELCNIKNYENK